MSQNLRPTSPLPTSEVEYRSRLQAAGVSEQQIALILGQQGPPEDLRASNTSSENALTTSLQNLSLVSSANASKVHSQPYPFNLPKSAPIVLHNIDIPNNDDCFCIVPPHESDKSRLYTAEFCEVPNNIRPELRLLHHKDQDTAYTRTAGSCTYSVQGINLKFPWIEWGDWYQQASGTRSQHFNSDTGVLPGKVMYWEKDVAGYHGKPIIFMLRCKITDQGLEDEEKPKPEDRVVVTVEVRVESEPDIVTFAPGIIEKQDQLDEMLMIALAVKQKFHLDMVVWKADTKQIKMDDMSKFNDLSEAPDNCDGWGGENGINVTQAADTKAAKKARWKERAKLFGSSAKLAHQVGQFSMNIAAMNGAQ